MFHVPRVTFRPGSYLLEFPLLLIYPCLPPKTSAADPVAPPFRPRLPFIPTKHPLQPPWTESFPAPHLGALQLPGDPSHDVHSISTPNSNADAAQATAIGGMGISANQKNPRVCIVFQNDLKKNPRF